MIDIGSVSFYLVLKIDQNREKYIIKPSQLAYINKVLSKFYLDKTYVVNILIKELAILK